MLLQIVQELHQDDISTIINTDRNPTEKDTEVALASDCQVMVILRAENIREGKALLKNFIKEKQSYVSLSDLLPEIDIIRKSAQVTT
jgi:histidyl-tRNA synthetase